MKKNLFLIILYCFFSSYIQGQEREMPIEYSSKSIFLLEDMKKWKNKKGKYKALAPPDVSIYSKDGDIYEVFNYCKITYMHNYNYWRLGRDRSRPFETQIDRFPITVVFKNGELECMPQVYTNNDSPIIKLQDCPFDVDDKNYHGILRREHIYYLTFDEINQLLSLIKNRAAPEEYKEQLGVFSTNAQLRGGKNYQKVQKKHEEYLEYTAKVRQKKAEKEMHEIEKIMKKEAIERAKQADYDKEKNQEKNKVLAENKKSENELLHNSVEWQKQQQQRYGFKWYDKFLSFENNGVYIDDRDGQSYDWVLLKDGKKWMTQNLNYQMEGAYSYDEREKYRELSGLLYDEKAILNACPKGWRLPTKKEWNSTVEYGLKWMLDTKNKASFKLSGYSDDIVLWYEGYDTVGKYWQEETERITVIKETEIYYEATIDGSRAACRCIQD